MTPKQLLGLFLVSLPFLSLMILLIYFHGIKVALFIFGMSAVIVGLIFLGVWLIQS